MESSPANPTLIELANQILASATVLTDALKASGQPPPSFAADSPVDYPETPEIQQAQAVLAQSTTDLFHLALGPAGFIRYQVFTPKYDTMSLDVLSSFNVFSAVPLDGSASYSEVASKVGIPEDMLRRILRQSMTQRIFAETAPGSGRIVHTAASAVFVKKPQWHSWVGHNVDECNRSVVRVVDSIRRYGDGDGEPGQTPFALAMYPDFPKETPWFQWAAQEGEGEKQGWRMRRFGEAMSVISSEGSFGSSALQKNYDWSGLGPGATMVDVGGSTGHVSFKLAEAIPQLRCIVQDLPTSASQFEAARPAALADRVKFQAHDFFKEQPVRGADVYFLRRILHDWSDKYVQKIVRALLPAMGPRSRILVNDFVFPQRGQIPWMAERMLTTLDMQMMIGLNSRERSIEEWTQVFVAADPRFQLKSVVQLPGMSEILMEFVLAGTE